MKILPFLVANESMVHSSKMATVFTRSIVLLLLAAPVSIEAQHGNVTSANPAPGPVNREAGARIFRVQCAGCHGLDGSGSAGGSDLTTGLFRHGSSDEALFRNIAKGIQGTAMAGTSLNGREIWQVITFVRSLAIGKGAERITGDSANGARLFQTSGCMRCHSISGRGGLLGPDLSGIGARRSLAELERSLLDPNAEVAPDFWSLHVRTKAGEQIAGIRLNEDTYSFQMLDSTGRLRSFLKEDLLQYEIIQTSPMPPLKGKLSPAELNDLIAYLATQRGEAESGGTER